MLNRILLTGGKGRFGTEISKLIDVDATSHKELDFTKPIVKGKYGLVIHAGAYTNVAGSEKDIKNCFDANVYGTFNLVNTYKDIPFIYISTEYAHKPLGIYAHTKRIGEEIVKFHPRHLIIRTLFKSNPFPFSNAYIDQMTQGDYVDIIAKLVVKAIANWDTYTSQLIYVGTGRKTMYDLARRTRSDIKPCRVDDFNEGVKAKIVPKDYI